MSKKNSLENKRLRREERLERKGNQPARPSWHALYGKATKYKT